MRHSFGLVLRLERWVAVVLAAAMAVAVGSQLAVAAPGDPPAVTDPVVSDIRVGQVHLEATINPNGAETGAQFMCRRAVDPPGSEFNCGGGLVGAGSEPVLFSIESSDDLEPETEYLVRVEADNANGVTSSNEVPFETLAALPPAVTVPTVTGITNDAATLTADVDSNGSPTTYHFEYKLAADPDWISVPDSDVSAGGGADPIEVSRHVAGLEASSEYVVRIVATNDHGTDTSNEETFDTLAAAPPTVTTPGVTDITATSARFTGRVHPNGEDGASWRFEYRQVGAPGWTPLPDPDESFTGFDPVLVSREATALAASTDYEVRLVATGAGGTTEGAIRSFTTGTGASPGLDERAFEQVSPPNKGDADLEAGTPAVAAVSGDRVAFQAIGAFAGAVSSGRFGTYLSDRGSSAWATKFISPPLPTLGTGTAVGGFVAFTDDLSAGILQTQDPPTLAPGDTPNLPDFFRRDNDADTFELLTTQPGSIGGGGIGDDPQFSWASSDLEHAVFSTVQGSTWVPGAPDQAAYYLADGDVSVASIQPGGSEPFADAGAGAALGREFGGNFRSVSDDGSRIFFTSPSAYASNTPAGAAQLYARIDHGAPGAETVHLSAPEPGVVDPNGTSAAFFRGASASGSKVFFTSCERLTDDSTADGANGFGQCDPTVTRDDLYLYDFEANGGNGDLIDLTTSDPDGGRVHGVVGISDDGSRVYFIANGDLGGPAVEGQPNLYLWEEGAGIVHVATVAAGEESSLLDPSIVTTADESRVSPDGRFLTFSSTAQLTSYDPEGTSQVYLWDAEQPGELVCASCAPGGDPPANATLGNQLQGLTFSSFARGGGKQNLAPGGRRVFFETAEALVAEDTNARVDVYEYDAAAGAVGLISTGKSSSRSTFAGASPDGKDVFFWTRERLVGWDKDSFVDVYDARVGGGLPEPPADQPSCQMECQGPGSDRPLLRDPGSADFDGQGDLQQPERPSFTVRRLSPAARSRLARGRTATLRIRVNRRGKVSAIGRARVGTRSVRVIRASKTAPRAGTVKLPLRLSRPARRELADDGSLRVSLSIRFTGVREATALTLNLRRASGSANGKGR